MKPTKQAQKNKLAGKLIYVTSIYIFIIMTNTVNCKTVFLSLVNIAVK